MKVTITDPCRVDGEHQAAGTVIDVNDNDALAIVGAGRGTIDPARAEAAVTAAAEKAAKKS